MTTPDEDALLRTLTAVVNTLTEAGIRFAIGGGCAVYARGGPASDHDVDVFLDEHDIGPAVAALKAVGMRPVEPPEDWLTKVYDGDRLVDLVFRPNGRPVTTEMLDRAQRLRVGAAVAPVLSGTDLLVDKLLVLDAHRCDLSPLLHIARVLREQVDWTGVARQTAGSPYARCALRLFAELGISEPLEEPAGDNGYLVAHVRRALAEDARTAELGVRVDVSGGAIRLEGDVECARRRQDVADVVADNARGMAVYNEIHVLDPSGHSEPEEVR
ncbi:BON domain-containing protein [Amycolatopsis suaedae]|uniref:BON domain-containing protein n=1 Tax=Amycolatopsis suaedae TaxID=2510978 RepID=A0A4Q7JAD9_9PSEU|nr:BON domain-containing protein [Amycolatopsis suaedae]RZQ63882.1 BON domain-containing protein [Amycolatopsis suaedae]